MAEYAPTPGKWFVKKTKKGVGVYVKRNDGKYGGDTTICHSVFHTYGPRKEAERAQKIKDCEFIAHTKNRKSFPLSELSKPDAKAPNFRQLIFDSCVNCRYSLAVGPEFQGCKKNPKLDYLDYDTICDDWEELI